MRPRRPDHRGAANPAAHRAARDDPGPLGARRRVPLAGETTVTHNYTAVPVAPLPLCPVLSLGLPLSRE